MRGKMVYLAGPISGLTFGSCTDWRQYAAEYLADNGITAVSPMRAKDYLAQLPGAISAHGQEFVHMSPLSTARGVITRDRFDTTTCDLVLANLLGADRVSVGTMIEFGWADATRRPVVCAIEPQGNVHEHMMVNEIIGFRCPTLDEALNIVCAILHTPGSRVYSFPSSGDGFDRAGFEQLRKVATKQ